MNAFETLIADFAEKTGLTFDLAGSDSVDVVADGMVVSVQYRPDRDDCIVFTLPLGDEEPTAPMCRRALELAANGAGSGGNFLGIKEGVFVLSSVLPLDGLSAETFAKRLISMVEISRRVAETLLLATVEGMAESDEPPSEGDGPREDESLMRV